MSVPRSLKGQRFGRLVALERLPEKYRQGAVWLCQCDCGRQYKVPRQSLVTYSTTSCGCRGRGPKAEDLTNRTFGRLTVLRHAFTGRSGTCWHVRCACGREGLRNRKSLMKGATHCGCERRKRDES